MKLRSREPTREAGTIKNPFRAIRRFGIVGEFVRVHYIFIIMRMKSEISVGNVSVCCRIEPARTPRLTREPEFGIFAVVGNN